MHEPYVGSTAELFKKMYSTEDYTIRDVRCHSSATEMCARRALEGSVDLRIFLAMGLATNVIVNIERDLSKAFLA